MSRYRSHQRARQGGVAKALFCSLPLLASLLPSVTLAQEPPLTNGEITPYCVPSPMPTDEGQRASTGVEYTRDGSTLKVTYWRQPCAEGDGQLIVTFTPITGTPYVCVGDRDVLIQDGRSTSGYQYTLDVDGSATRRLCGFITEAVSALVDVYDAEFDFDDDAEMLFRTVWGTGPLPFIINAPVPAYVNPPASPYIYPHGHFSGSYYDPARPGEGVLLEVGEVGERKILLVSWYTYDQGRPLWILGNVDFEAGDTVISVPLKTYAGAQFGAEFDPNDVVATAWGEVRISFPTCQHVNIDWERFADGASGTYTYTRLASRLLGTSCRHGSSGAP